MNRAVIYARVSTERQREKNTIDSQLSVLPEIIKQKGYKQTLEPYIDDGISGETISERPAMIRLLEDAERGLFDAVFVVDIDRLTRARKSIDWEYIKDSLRKGNVKVVTPSQEYDFDDEDQEFMSDLFSTISGYEKKKIIRRLMRGKREKAKQGKFIGGKSPFGYTYDEETKEYEIVEEEAKVVRLIFDLYLQGFGVMQIPEQLDKLGIPTPTLSKGYKNNNNIKKNKWAGSTITKILKNKSYAGEFIRWTNKRSDRTSMTIRPEDEWIITDMPPIIDIEIYELTQEALKSRRVLSKRNSKRQYLLSGLIHCESCGYKMTGVCNNSRNELLYYICHNSRRKTLDKPCPIRSVRADDIEFSVWEEIKSLLKTPELLKKAILESKNIDNSDQNIEDLTDLLKVKQNEEERLIDLYQFNNIERDKLNQRIENLNEDKASIRSKIETIKETNKVDTRLKTINELKFELETDIDSFDYEQKRKVLTLLLTGSKEVGIFISSDYSVEIRGLIDFSKFNNNSDLEEYSGIKNTSYKGYDG